MTIDSTGAPNEGAKDTINAAQSAAKGKPKLCSKRKKGQRNVTFWANEQAVYDLAYLRKLYQHFMEREVSTSILVRVALDALRENLQKALENRKFDVVKDHAFRLARSVR